MENPITELSQLDMDKTYSYADYAMWRLKERIELFKGKIFKMSPAPNIEHQSISGNLFGLLFQYFINHPCKLLPAPTDIVLLNKKKSTVEKEIFTVLQPDICIVCDLEKLKDGKKCVGAPDLVIEILSPGNSKKEMSIKFDLYEEAGVKEYWMVHPQDRSVQIFTLRDDKFIGLKPVIENQILNSPIFPDLKMDLRKIFV